VSAPSARRRRPSGRAVHTAAHAAHEVLAHALRELVGAFRTRVEGAGVAAPRLARRRPVGPGAGSPAGRGGPAALAQPQDGLGQVDDGAAEARPGVVRHRRRGQQAGDGAQRRLLVPQGEERAGPEAGRQEQLVPLGDVRAGRASAVAESARCPRCARTGAS
jgi:hypothetical protein